MSVYECDKGNNFLRATPGGVGSRVTPWSAENFNCEALCGTKYTKQ